MLIKRAAIVFGALLLALLTTPSIASVYSRQGTFPTPNGGKMSQAYGKNKFVVRNVGSRPYFDVYVGTKLVFTVREQNVDICGSGSGLITDFEHDFYLSPDHRHLFVEQKAVHCYGVGTLYGPGPDGKVRPIRPHGMPFDSAAIRAFEHVIHLDPGEPHDDDSGQQAYGEETRVIHFVRWTPHGVDFIVALANFYCGSAPLNEGENEYDWSGHYDFRTGRFTHMYIIDRLTHQGYLQERKRLGE